MLSITEVDDYLRGLRDRIAAVQEESSASDKLLLTTNVFEQIQDHISSLAIHQVLSKYLEKLITLLAHSLIEDPVNDIVEKRDLCISLCNQLLLKGDVEVLSKDVFGSHVLQSTLQCCTLFEHQGASISEPLRYFATTVEDRCLFELLHHTSGSHVLRSLMKALVGVLDAEAFQKAKRKSADKPESLLHNKHEVEEWRFTIVEHWIELFCKDLMGSLTTSQACATVCLALRLCKQRQGTKVALQCNQVLAYSISHCNESKIASYAAEQCIDLCDNAEFNQVWKTSILPNAKEIAENSFGNYVLQAVTRNKYFQPTHLEELLETIDMGNLLLTSSSSVVWRICEAAVSLGTGQSQFIKKLQDALHISQYKTKQLKKAKQRETELPPRTDVAPEQYDATENKSDDDDPSVKHNDSEKVKGHIWLALISCQPPEPNRIHLRATGASILLNLLKFDRKLLTNILGDFKHFIRIAKAQQKLLSLATDRHFSRVLQLMLDRRQGLLKEKGIERLFNYLKAHFVELALNINGAFVLSSLFNASPLRLRQSLLTELAPESERIKAKSKKLVEIIGLESFCKNKEQWSKKMSKAQSVRTLFKDIIDTNELH
ncbi:Pumilio-family RNA binding repeat protein [Babesia bovis T2Bo]|uniref:Pumilio-family RNA binding repeat protein n=1 Tax=Babesia bovis T2Bo TaxID=484906 RepID=UPI001C35B861|nr:Pumilio-family RNA binding repeat protein [Babesia bovis T2Bo]EDO07879.2 Pumilio-family RNA binding repeat protein [Babesia bovis T2Bo]